MRTLALPHRAVSLRRKQRHAASLGHPIGYRFADPVSDTRNYALIRTRGGTPTSGRASSEWCLRVFVGPRNRSGRECRPTLLL